MTYKQKVAVKIELHKSMLDARLARCADDYQRFHETAIQFNFLCDSLLNED